MKVLAGKVVGRSLLRVFQTLGSLSEKVKEEEEEEEEENEEEEEEGGVRGGKETKTKKKEKGKEPISTHLPLSGHNLFVSSSHFLSLNVIHEMAKRGYYST
jgi:hypothetical protein